MELTLSEFPTFTDNPQLLNNASFHNGYKRINIDIESNSSLLNALISFLSKNNSFTEICFSAKISSDLELLTNSNVLNQIKQLIFENFKLESKLIDSVVKIINNSSLELLEFSSCLDDNTTNQLLTKLSSSQKFNEIPIISFSNNNSTILKYLSAFSNKKKLILRNCEFEILPVLQSISGLNATQIESIDLTGNQCTKPASQQLNLPSTLNEIILDEVQFTFSTFNNLFTTLMNHIPQEKDVYHVSIAGISLKESEWKQFLSQIDKISAKNLAKLNWSGNQINKPFIRFVNSTKSLLSLNISGCIDNTPETTNLIPTLLKQNYTLRELIIDSYDMNELDDDSAKIIIDNIKNNHSLKSLSLDDQPIDDENTVGLAKSLLDNRRIKKLNFNFAGTEEDQTILSFFETLKNRGIPLYIKYPTDAIEKFADLDEDPLKDKTAELQSIKEGVIGKINQTYDIVFKGNKGIKVPDESIAFANEEGHIIIGGDNSDEDDDFNGLNYDPIRKQNWKNNVASNVGATRENMREAGLRSGNNGIQYNYISPSELPQQPSQVQPNYKSNDIKKAPESLFDLDDDEIREIVNKHRADPSKVAPNRLPISPQEFSLYSDNRGAYSGLPPLGDPNNLPPLGDLPPLGKVEQRQHRNAIQGNNLHPMDFPPLGNLPSVPGVDMPPPPPQNFGNLPPPPTGMNLPPPPPGMSLPPPPPGMTLPPPPK